LSVLAARAASWDGTAKAAHALRDELRELEGVRQKGGTPGEQALLSARSGYRKRRPPDLARAACDPSWARALAPFVGDPEMGAWPFHQPLTIDDDVAAGWLRVLAHGAVVDAALRTFVITMFRVRRRQVWIPASFALAKLAQRDDKLLALLLERWRESFPKGLPAKWSGEVLARAPRRKAARGDDPDHAHAARHVFHAACAWLAASTAGVTLDGLAAADFAALALPHGDASDASVVLHGLAALVRGPATVGAVLPHLAMRVTEAMPSPLCDEALRELATALESVVAAPELRATVTERLARPSWRGMQRVARLDNLASWVDTARWLAERGDSTRLGALRDDAGEARPLLELALDGTIPAPGNAVDAASVRLARVLDDDVWDTTPDRERALLVAELLALLDHADVAPLPWGALVHRAAPRASLEPAAGTVAEAARADLAVLCARRDYPPRTLLREAQLSEAVVLHLAGCQDGYVARQVAIELERHLRVLARAARGEAAAGVAQAKLCWRLLQRNPPSVTLRELARVLRGTDTDLHRLVRALGRLDELRDRGAAVTDIAEAYRVAAVATHRLGDREAPSMSLLGTVADSLVRAAELDEEGVGSEAWLRALSRCLLGERGEHGLDQWLRWLGAPAPGLESRWQRFAAAAAALRRASPRVDEAHCEELASATAELSAAISSLSWPEETVLRRALALTERWIERARDQARRRAAEVERVTAMLDRGDEEGVLDVVATGEALDLLGADELRRMARFLLLRLRYRAAARLRREVRERVLLPGPWTHVAPLIAGVSSGTLLVLDVGIAWNDVVSRGHETGYVATVAIALLLSLAQLAIRVAAVSPPRPGMSRVGWVTRLGVRIAPTYLGALFLACTTSGIVLWTLAGTAARQVNDVSLPFAAQTLLWGSLSLFLGIFLGLVVQGKSTFSDG
jgi:hypothetical protein